MGRTSERELAVQPGAQFTAAELSAAEPKTGTPRLSWLLVRNSPWVAIAVGAHVILVAVMGVVYMAEHAKADTAKPIEMSVVKTAPIEMPPDLREPEELIDRGAVPVFDEKDEGPVNPNADYVPDAPPGKKGEITDERDATLPPGHFNPDPEALENMPSGAPGGTPIGVGGPGHRGLAVSAYSSRVAGANGRGGGGLGQGGGDGKGGRLRRDPVTNSTNAALRWLKNHQSADGRWDADGFGQQCKQNSCGGPGESVYDPGLSGLALLCFLGAGETHQSGMFKPTVKEGLKFLKSSQDSEGCFGPRTSAHFMYNHACASLAMTEAFGMTQSTTLKDSAQRGLDFIHQSQNPYLAWRYGVRDGDNDTSVTGWMVMGLKSGVMSGLEVDKGAFTGALAWVDKMTEPEFGKTGYQQRGGPSARTTPMQQRFPATNSEAMTAAGVLTRIFSGQAGKDDPQIRKGADLMARQLPKWDIDGGTIDFYYWYYGTLAMFQVGGEHWKRWNDAMKTAIVDHQRMQEGQCEYGSWDPDDPWSPEGGRVYATALNCLSTEVYYRYDRVFVGSGGDRK